MSSCYISGPMRGIKEYNYPAFMSAAKELRELGWKVFNPAEMDIENDEMDYASRTLEEQKIHDKHSNTRRFARRDLRILLDELAAEDGDAVIVLLGWMNSIGARAEVAVAEWVGLPIIPLPEALDGGA